MTYDVGVGITLSALDSALGRSCYMVLFWILSWFTMFMLCIRLRVLFTHVLSS
jgi:hypothetical protein